MKLIIKILLFLLAAVLAGLLVAQPAIAEAPQSNSVEINPPYGPIKLDIVPSVKAKTIESRKTSTEVRRHSTRAEKQISEEQLRLFLDAKGSPLAAHSSQILNSPFWSTIIGICWIEQYRCTKAPGNNYWGIMCAGKVCRYSSLEQGIQAISNLLAKYETKGKDTLEELNGYYVQPASANWFNTVLKIKTQVESL